MGIENVNLPLFCATGVWVENGEAKASFSTDNQISAVYKGDPIIVNTVSAFKGTVYNSSHEPQTSLIEEGDLWIW